MCWGFGKPHLARETWQLQLAFVMGYAQFSSVTQSCLTLCNPMDCCMPGFSVLHQLLDLAQTHVIESVMPSNHLTLCHPLRLLPSIFSRIRVFSNKSAVCIRCPKYWSFSISPSNEYSGLISFKIDRFWSPCCPRHSQESSPAPQFESTNSLALYLLGPALITFTWP